MVTPGLAQAVSAIVSLQSNLIADGRDELPGLATLNRFSIGVGLVLKNIKFAGLLSTPG